MKPQKVLVMATPIFPMRSQPKIQENNPKYPFRDLKHYLEPSRDFKKVKEYGYTAQLSIDKKPLDVVPSCQTPDPKAKNPWFKANSKN